MGNDKRSIDSSVGKAVKEEIADTDARTKKHEAEATQKGIPLKLQGARYRIYETEKN